MFNLPTITPGIYKLVFDKETEQYGVRYYADKFTMRKKIYGDLEEESQIAVDLYRKRLSGAEAMGTGEKGGGKTTLMELICNKAIEQLQLPVIYVRELTIDIDTLNYLSMLTNVVIFIDEFGKNIPRDLQEKMLTMLSSKGNGKRMLLLTENHEYLISEFILGRPGRVLLHYQFDRLPKAVLEEYCADYNVQKEFFDSLLHKWKETSEFSFDQMEKLVELHTLLPDKSFESQLKRANVGSLARPPKLKVVSITREVDDPENEGKKITRDVKFDFSEDFTKGEFNKGYTVWINLIDEDVYSLKVNNNHVVDISNDGKFYMLQHSNFKVQVMFS